MLTAANVVAHPFWPKAEGQTGLARPRPIFKELSAAGLLEAVKHRMSIAKPGMLDDRAVSRYR